MSHQEELNDLLRRLRTLVEQTQSETFDTGFLMALDIDRAIPFVASLANQRTTREGERLDHFSCTIDVRWLQTKLKEGKLDEIMPRLERQIAAINLLLDMQAYRARRTSQPKTSP